METEYSEAGDGFPYPLGSVRDILTALFKHKTKIITVFFLVFGVVAGYVFTLVPLYEARTSLLLKLGREHIFRPEVGKDNQIVEYNEDAALQSEIEIISSKDLIRRVVSALGVEKVYPEFLDPSLEINNPLEKSVSTFLKNLLPIPVKGSSVLEISYLNPRPEVAAEALNLLVDLLKEKHLQVFSDPKASFLTKQLHTYQEKLEQSEANLQAFKHRHDLSSPLVEQQRRLLDQRANLDSDYKTTKNKLQGLVGKIASLDTQMKTILDNISVSTVEEGGNLEKAKAELFALKREEQKLLTKYTDNSVPVLNLRKEIDQVEQFILAEQKNERANTIASGKKAMYSELEKERLGAMSESTTLQASSQVIALQIEDLDKNIQRLDELNKELIVLERQRAADEQNYNLYLTRVEEANVSEEMDRLKMANISVIQRAEVPGGPAGRSPILLLTVGAILGILAGAGFGLLLEYFQGAYTRPEQAANDLNLPLLATFGQKL
ncbi:MAG: GumC family protein [Nitrospira sp.]|nr:GumC family protein [Nitrospira sp.]